MSGSLGRDVLLFLLQLQHCECEKQAGITPYFGFSFGFGWLCRTAGLLTTGVLLAPRRKRIILRCASQILQCAVCMEAGDGDPCGSTAISVIDVLETIKTPENGHIGMGFLQRGGGIDNPTGQGAGSHCAPAKL